LAKRGLTFGRKTQDVRRDLLPESIYHMAGGRAAHDSQASVKYCKNLFVHQEMSFGLRIDTSLRKFCDAEANYLTRLQYQHHDGDPRSEHLASPVAANWREDPAS
jgi:hypothetical protein